MTNDVHFRTIMIIENKKCFISLSNDHMVSLLYCFKE